MLAQIERKLLPFLISAKINSAFFFVWYFGLLRPPAFFFFAVVLFIINLYKNRPCRWLRTARP
nr:MAG TPA: hypothetical protein [Herelleviridae sp.]